MKSGNKKALARYILLMGGVVLAALYAAGWVPIRQTASAAQNPPPASYNLTVSAVGGDSQCFFTVDPPSDTTLKNCTYSASYASGVQIGLQKHVFCPSEYEFDYWESNNTNINGVHSRRVSFAIYMNTWVVAHFTQEIVPRVTNLHATNVAPLTPAGELLITYAWNSSTGNLADLAGQEIFEVLSYDLSTSFEEDVLPFLCSGLAVSNETITLSEPWNSLFGPQPVLKKGMQFSGYASAGIGGDHHTMPARPTGWTSPCYYTLRQWYVVDSGCGFNYLAAGPFDVVRSFAPNASGDWQYCIQKHGTIRCMNVP